jgi:hypothetical protein
MKQSRSKAEKYCIGQAILSLKLTLMFELFTLEVVNAHAFFVSPESGRDFLSFEQQKVFDLNRNKF